MKVPPPPGNPSNKLSPFEEYRPVVKVSSCTPLRPQEKQWVADLAASPPPAH